MDIQSFEELEVIVLFVIPVILFFWVWVQAQS